MPIDRFGFNAALKMVDTFDRVLSKANPDNPSLLTRAEYVSALVDADDLRQAIEGLRTQLTTLLKVFEEGTLSEVEDWTIRQRENLCCSKSEMASSLGIERSTLYRKLARIQAEIDAKETETLPTEGVPVL